MDKPWSVSKEEVVSSSGSNPIKGLSQNEARKRLAESGPNRLVKPREISLAGVFWEEVREPMILLLLFVGVVYAFLGGGSSSDAITIFIVIIALVFTEILTEYRAKKAIIALRKLAPPSTPVLRDGIVKRLAASDVVKGDVVILEVGERVPADGRVIESLGLEADESPLTGESVTVAKDEKVIPQETPLAERSNMVYTGTTITRGRGKMVVTATSMETELGRITGLVLEAKEPKTPLQLAMKQLTGLLVWVAVSFSVLIPVIGILEGKNYKIMILTGLSLSFATIPEELPIIITMVLGVGALALSRKHVLIRRLRAAETLGSVTVIVTDKTGTITENRMTLASISTIESKTATQSDGKFTEQEKLVLRIGAMTSSIHEESETGIGDPLEIALVSAAEKYGAMKDGNGPKLHAVREFSFDNQRKMMSVVFAGDGETMVYVKGAPEAILMHSKSMLRGGKEMLKTSNDEAFVRGQVEAMAADALRVIAFGYLKTRPGAALTQEEAEKGLVFAGLAGFSDPPREGVAEALKITKQAGIRTIVVSGDHPLTVQKVAAQVGLDAGKVIMGAELEKMDDAKLKETLKSVSLYARTNPEQKLKIVKALQEMDEIVAVTGDGINDAPALKTADIGVAMGETGTEVARETAGMVLTDDSFTSVAAGVREGRKIFDNLKKGVTYYLSVKVALILSFVVPLALGIEFPFAPIQIILLELFMDLAASATFVAEPMEPSAMSIPPRGRKAKFVDRAMITNLSLGAASLAAAVLINYLVTWYGNSAMVSTDRQVLAQTVAFATWLVGHIFLAMTMRSDRSPIWKQGIFSNRVMLVWAAAGIAFLVVVTNVSAIHTAIKVTALDGRQWAMAFIVPFVAIFWQEIRKMMRKTG
jgi:Ca2+-transporting ATPase